MLTSQNQNRRKPNDKSKQASVDLSSGGSRYPLIQDVKLDNPFKSSNKNLPNTKVASNNNLIIHR